MEFMFNKWNSLPQQVEENKENISALMNLFNDGVLTKSSEVLQKLDWTQNGDYFEQTVSVPYMTSEKFIVVVPGNTALTTIKEFTKLKVCESLENNVKFKVVEKPSIDIVVDVWYNVSVDD